MPAITAAPAAKQPFISLISWAGAPEQCPQWVGYPTRENFPADLIWSGAADVPAIGGVLVPKGRFYTLSS